MSNQLTELLAKVEGAAEGSNDLDVALHHAFGPPLPLEYWSESDTVPYENRSWALPFSRSIDKATALVERVMPGHRAGFQPGIGGRAHGHIIAITDVSAHLVRGATATTAPLAILGSLLKALIAQDAAGSALAVQEGGEG
jgi:hypothetical protein